MGVMGTEADVSNAVRQAIEVLAQASGMGPEELYALFKRAGVSLANPVQGTVGQEAGSPLTSGHTLFDADIYMRDLESAKDGRTPRLYMADDYLRGPDGEPLILNFREAVREATKLNGGRSYGDGSEAALRKAIDDGSYREGDRFVSWKADLHGKDRAGAPIGRRNLVALLKVNDPAVSKIAKTLAKASGDGLWVVSGKEHRVITSDVFHVRSRDGGGDWFDKDYDYGRSAVVLSRVRYGAPAA